MHKLHCYKGNGLTAQAACDRSIFRGPLGCKWSEYKELPLAQRCEACEKSKQVALNLRTDAAKAQAEMDAWTPEAPDAWKTADDAIVAAHKAK